MANVKCNSCKSVIDCPDSLKANFLLCDRCAARVSNTEQQKMLDEIQTVWDKIQK